MYYITTFACEFVDEAIFVLWFYRDHQSHAFHHPYVGVFIKYFLLLILVKVPCEYITGNIARGCGREPIKHEPQLSALFA